MVSIGMEGQKQQHWKAVVGAGPVIPEGYIEVEIMSISSGQSRPLLYLDDISDQI